jgi:hypothetical protein
MKQSLLEFAKQKDTLYAEAGCYILRKKGTMENSSNSKHLA